MKKKKTPKDKKNADTTPNLSEEMQSICQDLVYTSETDAPIEPFTGEKADAVTPEIVVSQTGNAADSNVEVREIEDFFTNLVEIQDWYGDEEKKTVEKFVALKQLLENELQGAKVFKIGKTQIDVYMVGLNAEGILSGAKTKAVET